MAVTEPERLTQSQRIGYALGSFGTGGFGTVPGLLLLYYLTDNLGRYGDAESGKDCAS